MEYAFFELMPNLVVVALIFFGIFDVWSKYFRYDWIDKWSFWEGVVCPGEDGIERSHIRSAVKAFRKDCQRLKAINKLATAYAQGVGVQRNYARAFFWFTIAAEKGYPESQYNLGIMYEYGLGTNSDYWLAELWYGRAADKGLSRANNALERLRSRR